MSKRLRVLVVGQPKGWFINRLREEAKQANLEVHACRTEDLIAQVGSDSLSMSVGKMDLLSFDVVHLFTVQSGRQLWQAAAAQLSKKGVTIVDRNCLDGEGSEQSIFGKLVRQSEMSLPFPATTFMGTFMRARNFLKTAPRPIVVKTLNSRRGRGVALIRNAWDFWWFLLTQRSGKFFAFREFIDADGDYRVTVIDGRVHSAVLRRGQPGEWRNNISLGGVGTDTPLAAIPEVVRIAEKAAHEFGFDIAGVDIMVAKTGEPYILEINRSPEMDSFEEISHVNLTAEVAKMYRRRWEQTHSQ